MGQKHPERKNVYIPFGKALIPVEVPVLNGCHGCFNEGTFCVHMDCNQYDRADGKTVIYKLVDYKQEGVSV